MAAICGDNHNRKKVVSEWCAYLTKLIARAGAGKVVGKGKVARKLAEFLASM
jgi:hypothetical protein